MPSLLVCQRFIRKCQKRTTPTTSVFDLGMHVLHNHCFTNNTCWFLCTCTFFSFSGWEEFQRRDAKEGLKFAGRSHWMCASEGKNGENGHSCTSQHELRHFLRGLDGPPCPHRRSLLARRLHSLTGRWANGGRTGRGRSDCVVVRKQLPFFHQGVFLMQRLIKKRRVKLCRSPVCSRNNLGDGQLALQGLEQRQ